MTSFKKQIPEYRELIDDSLNKILPASNQSSKELNLAMAYSVLNGGKRIRPLMMLASAKTLDVDIQEVIPFAASIELLHSFSLIHDDLPCMDNDKLRRGKPTAHIKFGESTAVLAGNSLLTMAFEILSHKDLNLSEKIKINLINKISESSGHLGIAGGQYLDLSFEHKKVSKKKIVDMEIKKTGKLFSFCCVAPLIIKKKSKQEINKFENIGADIGLLFQVADDLIDNVEVYVGAITMVQLFALVEKDLEQACWQNLPDP